MPYAGFRIRDIVPRSSCPPRSPGSPPVPLDLLALLIILTADRSYLFECLSGISRAYLNYVSKPFNDPPITSPKTKYSLILSFESRFRTNKLDTKTVCYLHYILSYRSFTVHSVRKYTALALQARSTLIWSLQAF